MRTLAEFKRSLSVGQVWRAYNHPMRRDMGARPVARIQSNAVTFQKPDGSESWLYFPKAGDFKVAPDGAIEIYEGSELILTYRKTGDLCPICGERVVIDGQTTDGRLIGTCRDAFTRDQWGQK